MSGAFNYNPEKFGGEKDHDVEVILRSLLEADGTALSKEVDSYVWAERYAEAKVIAYLWSLTRGFANQMDATRMTDFLPRWERIYGIRPISTDTENSRRAKVAAKIAMYGARPTQQVVHDLLAVIMNPVYVGIVITPSNLAVTRVPGGVTVPGGITAIDGPWYSTVSHIAIQTVKPASMSESEFKEIVAQIPSYLDDLLPPWTTYDWFRDGPHGIGFFLDEPHNLNNMRFA